MWAIVCFFLFAITPGFNESGTSALLPSEHPPKIWFERNDVHYRADNLDFYKEIMTANVTACMQLTHYRHPDEVISIGEKRLKKFSRELGKLGFDMSRIVINPDIHTIHCEALRPCHAQIYFEIISAEGHCDE
jgi:hypothetical protein